MAPEPPCFADNAARLAGQAMLLFGWTPDTFWAATPADVEMVLRAMTGPAGDTPPLGSAAMKAMMEAFPDG